MKVSAVASKRWHRKQRRADIIKKGSVRRKHHMTGRRINEGAFLFPLQLSRNHLKKGRIFFESNLRKAFEKYSPAIIVSATSHHLRWTTVAISMIDTVQYNPAIFLVVGIGFTRNLQHHVVCLCASMWCVFQIFPYSKYFLFFQNIGRAFKIE